VGANERPCDAGFTPTERIAGDRRVKRARAGYGAGCAVPAQATI
jgi:hypothetical protein